MRGLCSTVLGMISIGKLHFTVGYFCGRMIRAGQNGRAAYCNNAKQKYPCEVNRLNTAKNRRSVLARLFFSTLYISAFTFGGGFVIVTLMKSKFVDELNWIDEEEMLDLTALAQSAPGPIAINVSILVGWRVAGLAGMLTAVLGTAIPPVAILSVISLFYDLFSTNPMVALLLKGMQAGVAAVILNVVFGLGSKVVRSRSPLQLGIMAGAFAATVFFRINVILIILCAAITGLAAELVRRDKGGTAK